MPAALCPHCTRPTLLPDPWPHPGYTCPHCGGSVALAPAAAPAAPDFEFPDSRPRRVEYRNRTAASDSFGQGFGDTLGRFFGQLVAGSILLCLAAGAAAAGYVWWLSR